MDGSAERTDASGSRSAAGARDLGSATPRAAVGGSALDAASHRRRGLPHAAGGGAAPGRAVRARRGPRRGPCAHRPECARSGRPRHDRLVLPVAGRAVRRVRPFARRRRDVDPACAGDLEGEDAIATGFVLDGRLWLRTNLDAPNYRVIAAQCDAPGSERWETVIPEGKDVIEGFDRTRDRLAVLRLVRATSRLATYDLAGREEREVPLPSLGAIEFVEGEHDGHRIGYTFQSFTQPPIAFVADAPTPKAG